MMLPPAMTREDNIKIDMFSEACRSGDFEKVIQIYSTMSRNIQRKYALNGFPFELACHSGNLRIVSWLHNHHMSARAPCYDEAFYLACSGGHLAVVKWLYSLGHIDIYHERCRAFHRARINRHTDVLRFFVSLDKRFKAMCSVTR
jgi:hypothetical protein